jgi:hypothetical protein
LETPNFSAKQYVDQTAFNPAFGAVSGDIALALGCSGPGGLVHPETLVLAASGLAVNVITSLTFGIVFPQSSGAAIFAQGHGTIQGHDSQSYSVNFSGLVPASGSVTVYLAASLSQILQDALQIVGPPPGHPDYNPNFTPYTAYGLVTDTLVLAAVSGQPDNYASFELARVTLTPTTTGVVANTAYQQRFSGPNTLPPLQISANTILTPAYAGFMLQIVSGATLTFPLAAQCNGLQFSFSSATAAPSTIQTQGSDVIYGYGQNLSSGIPSFPLPQGASVTVDCFDGLFQIIGGTSQVATYPIQGGFKNLAGQTISNTSRTWTCDAIIVASAGGIATQLTNVNVSYSTGVIGANGYDGNGLLGTSQWLFDYIIWNSATNAIAALCSHSSSGPTLPSGYNSFARVGACYLDGSGNLMRVLQRGRIAQYQVIPGSNTPNLPIMGSGVNGNIFTPVYVAVAIADFAPPTAYSINLLPRVISEAGYIFLAPNDNFGSYASTSNPPFSETSASNQYGEANGSPVSMILESGNIYWTCNDAAGLFACVGWEDSI